MFPTKTIFKFFILRGFIVDEAVEEKGGYVMTPPRLQGKDAFSREEEKMSRDITTARCYTEIMNKRVKQFKFLRTFSGNNIYKENEPNSETKLSKV